MMRLFLSRLAMKFYNITTAALSADYHDTIPRFFSHCALLSDKEVDWLKAKIHRLNMEFVRTMRDDGQNRKIIKQQCGVSGYGLAALPKVSPPIHSAIAPLMLLVFAPTMSFNFA